MYSTSYNTVYCIGIAKCRVRGEIHGSLLKGSLTPVLPILQPLRAQCKRFVSWQRILRFTDTSVARIYSPLGPMKTFCFWLIILQFNDITVARIYSQCSRKTFCLLTDNKKVLSPDTKKVLSPDTKKVLSPKDTKKVLSPKDTKKVCLLKTLESFVS